jgi:hypothetical protein
MPTIDQFKEQQTPATPLFLFDCVLRTGATERWSTHAVTVNGAAYAPRLLQHNLFTLQSSSDDGLDGPQKISIVLANADSHYSQIERSAGFKGARVTVQFLFFDLAAGAPASESRVIFQGIAGNPEDISEASLRLSIANRLNLQRVVLPEVRIERRCPWMFPANASQRQEAATGGAKGKYSALYKCGYSPDQPGGLGNLNGAFPFTACDYTRASCEARGMFDVDQFNQPTRRFGGVEFVPAQIDVRSFGEKGSHLSAVLDNQARYSDSVPLVYGTVWYKPPVVFARNDGNLTRMEVLLGMGEIEDVVKVVVNEVEIPEGQSGINMTATGWFNLVTPGSRNGGFNFNFTDSTGKPLGDPYGSMAMLSVVVPNQISNGQALPTVEVLLKGLKLEQFDLNGNPLGESFTNNPAWVLLDVLRRSGWLTSEMDLTSFAATAAYCESLIPVPDLYGNMVGAPRFQCNLVVRSRMSAGEVVRGIRNGSALMLTYGSGGLLTLRAENTFALQQPVKPSGSNSVQTLNGGWPAYEFSDGSADFSGILRRPNGEPAVRLWSRHDADVPNRLTVEFQDEFNEYQQDSLALTDADDSLLTARQVTAAFPALGLPNFDQAARVLSLQLNKNIAGYTFIEFETSVKGVGLNPGDLITVTYLKEGLQRQPFRIVKLVPGRNYETVTVTAQWHDDAWYSAQGTGFRGGRRQSGSRVGLPRPLAGSVIDANGVEQFGIVETPIQSAEGSVWVDLEVSFTPPGPAGMSGAAVPIVGLNPTIQTTGGTLTGGQNLYYAVTALDAGGTESALSFIVRAKLPAGTNTNSVTLNGLSFSPGTAAFHVYRGVNPSQLLRIAANVALANTFTDSGWPAARTTPPDANYDHANFYWRWERQPEVAADITSSSTIGNSTLGMLPDDLVGATVRITRGTGAGQERTITANDATTITVTPAWTVTPDSTSYFVAADSTWNFGALAKNSPAHIQVPNRSGASVEVSGRSANANDQESPFDLNPLTSWQLGVGGGVDSGPAPLPVFGLNPGGQGTIELLGVSFPSLTNTHTISAGTLTLFYWNELNGPSTVSVASAIQMGDSAVMLDSPVAAQIGDLVQVEGEILQVTGVRNGGLDLDVQRGSHGSSPMAHALGTPIYLLQRKVTVVPFARGFFGSPASGSYTYSIFLPDVRVAAGEFFVTNSWGMSPVQAVSFGGTVDRGLRTLSGGQITIQVEGYLAVETDAAPPFVLEDSRAARDIFAVVREAPAGGVVELRLRQDNTPYCTLTIADGQTISNTVDGFGLPPLAANAQLSLDIVTVPSSAGSTPGRDLTVTVRL